MIQYNTLGLLLACPWLLSGEVTVIDIQRRPGILQVSLARTANSAEGLLTLIFADEPAVPNLIGMEAMDARRARNRIRLLGAQAGLVLDPTPFKPPTG